MTDNAYNTWHLPNLKASSKPLVDLTCTVTKSEHSGWPLTPVNQQATARKDWRTAGKTASGLGGESPYPLVAWKPQDTPLLTTNRNTRTQPKGALRVGKEDGPDMTDQEVLTVKLNDKRILGVHWDGRRWHHSGGHTSIRERGIRPCAMAEAMFLL